MENKLMPWGSNCPKCGGGSYSCDPDIVNEIDHMTCADCGCQWDEPMNPHE